MTSIDKLNPLRALEIQIKEFTKNSVYEKVLNDYVSDFKAEIEPKLKEAINKITIDGVTSFKDQLRMRDEIHVYVKFNDEENKTVIK